MPSTRALLCAALACTLTVPVYAQAPASAPAPTVAPAGAQIAGIEDFVDGVVAQQLGAREVGGAIVTVVQDGKIVFNKGYGYANVADRKPVDPQQTLFRPGSVSKLFTWVTLMQLIEQKRVDMDADVNRYIDFKIPAYEGKPIRVRDLFQHTPGMSDVGGIIVDSQEKAIPYVQWLKTKTPQRLWAPGTEISYSNFGAALAGYIVERVSGEPFVDYAEKHLFRPLGMTSTTFRDPLPPALAPRLATGYRFADGQLLTKAPEFLGSVTPAGSAVSTGPDMAKFMLAMLNKGTLNGMQVLKPESVAILARNSFANVDGLPGFAHGFMVRRDSGPRLIGHGGNTVDFHSDLVLAPELGTGFFMSYTGGNGSYIARTELSDAMVGRLFPQQPSKRWTGEAPAPVLGSYRGNRRDYTQAANPKNDIIVESAGPHLITIATGGVKAAWEQIGPNEYEKLTGIRVGGPFDRVKFYGTPQDPKLAFASQPHMAYHHVKAE